MKLLISVMALSLPIAATQAAPDWTKTVVATPEGGFRMGNPDAKVKLIEYASLTCPHCAKFHTDSRTPLAAYVKKGAVSYEFRNYVLNGVDVAATMSARCGGASKFFPMTRILYVTQRNWVGRLSQLPQSEKDKIGRLPVAGRLGRIAEVGGIDKIAAVNGVSASQLKTCLADDAVLKRLAGMVEAGRALGVQGTPAFVINGNKLKVNDWAGVEAEIKRAGG